MRTVRVLSPSVRGDALIDQYTRALGDAVLRHRTHVALRAARVETELSSRARSEFLANMSHELRTPLNAVIGFAGMLKRSEDFRLSSAQIAEYSDHILESAALLLERVNMVLDLAAIESRKIDVVRANVDLATLLRSVVERFREQAEAQEVKFDLKIGGNLGRVLADDDKLEKALIHIVGNALKFSPKGSVVRIAAAFDTRNGVRVAVLDQGPGMSEEELARAFQMFEQIDRGLNRKHEGMGLGLTIAKAFIEMQGGRVVARSAPGQGLAIAFTLPRSAQAAATENETGSAQLSA